MTTKSDDTSKVELSSLEYVIHLGSHGNHVLFDNERIKEAFLKKGEELTEVDNQVVGQVRKAINEVFSIPEFEGKREYISRLPEDVQDILIYLYFQMIEKNVLMNQKQYH